MLLTTEERRAGIGGSDVGAIMGANPYCSIIKLYKEKKGEVDPPSLNHAMRWGTILEDVIMGEYANNNNLHFDTDAVPLTKESGYITCPDGKTGVVYKPKIVRGARGGKFEYPWAYAHPDFFVQTGTPDNYKLSGIEIKTVSEGMYRKYWAEGEIPPWQYYQVVWYSMITGIDKWTMVGFAPHLRLSADPVLTHDLYIDDDTQSKVWDKVYAFWECLKNDTLPHVAEPSSDDLKLLYPSSTMDFVQSSTIVDAAVRRLYDVRMALKPLDMEEESLKNQIKSHMGDCGRLISQEGEELATFKSPKAKVKVDYRRIVDSLRKFFAEHPSDESNWALSELQACESGHTRAQAQTRRFLLKAKY